MSYVPIIAAAVAAAQQQEEEDELTRYTTDELAQDWEFKIVRSSFGAFGSTEKLRHLMAEEAEAGWIFLEKLDSR